MILSCYKGDKVKVMADKEAIKEVVRQEMDSFFDMIDCLDEPNIDYTTTVKKSGVTVKIIVDIE